MKAITFKRNKLYQEVWSTTISQLVKELGITHSQILKVCKELNIPTPRVGHWQKVQYGKAVEQIPLPSSSEKDTFTLIASGCSTSAESRRKESISVPAKLHDPHPLVIATRDYYKTKDEYFRGDRKRTTGSFLLDVCITKKLIDRAMRILDAIIKYGIKIGYMVDTSSYNNLSRSYFLVGEEKIYFRVFEIAQKRKIKLKNADKPHWGYDYELVLTGRLKVMLSDGTWFHTTRMISDSKTKKIENRLDKLFNTITDMAEKAKIERLRLEAYHRKREKEREEEARIIQERKAELKRRSKLEEQSEFYTRSQYIYQFIREIELQKSSLDLTEEESEKFDEWIAWACEHADRLDPLKQTINSILHP